VRASADGLRVLGLTWLLLVTTASAESPDLGELRDRGSLRALVTSEEYVEWFALKAPTARG
jgi:hypothetical protein